jgi:hypothetical protein
MKTLWSSEDGVTITLDQLLADTQLASVKKINVEKLAEKVLNWNDDPREWKKVKSVDLSYPPIVLMSGSEVTRIIDGNHRVQKAIQLGYKEINIKAVCLDELPIYYKKIFG